MDYLTALYPALSDDVLQSILDACSGDVEEAVHLIDMQFVEEPKPVEHKSPRVASPARASRPMPTTGMPRSPQQRSRSVTENPPPPSKPIGIVRPASGEALSKLRSAIFGFSPPSSSPIASPPEKELAHSPPPDWVMKQLEAMETETGARTSPRSRAIEEREWWLDEESENPDQSP
ncbi:hypothetical protein PAPYR_5716 [Paratrimastix pyriformis]|uniref:CUE domain-containing protein n=1 Tax=Paratrimastix pyriformis TaxID=342808 RepID=A0ABQ8UH10_9EUKA|nr:hypothetical protein PAPYR_5716 [Paratrimastix pyriformis]